MTQQTTLQARHAAAAARVKAATETLTSREQGATRAEAEFARLTAAVEADPKDMPANFAHGQAQGNLSRAKSQVTQAQGELAAARRELAELDRLLTGDAALEKARQNWRGASTAQVEATKAAQAARGELARLDTDLREAEAKVEEAQSAQRTSILAAMGYRKEPAAKVADAEGLLLGAAATVDALRTARPELEAKVADAEAALVSRDKETQRAVQGIVNAKAAIAEAAALQALEQCRAAVQSYHAATAAAGRGYGERFSLYELHPSVTAADAFERQVERLKASAFAGE
jgi:hypothetical protein